MALELLITFRDPKRKGVFHPFSLQDVLKRAWWPLAKRLALPMLQRLECLNIRTQAEAETLVREFEVVRNALTQPQAVSISNSDAAYLLKRIGEIEPLIQAAIQNWDEVESISL